MSSYSLHHTRDGSAVRPVTIVSVVAFIVFVALVLLVSNDLTAGVDESLMLIFRNPGDLADPIGPHWFEETAADLTALGGYPLLVPIVIMAAIGLLLMARKQAALFLVLAIASGAIVSSLLKEVFARPRPDLVEHADRVFTSSFPSAHAMVSAVTWLTLAAIMARFVTVRTMRRFMVGAAVAITLTVGISRVYLGVHWPSDVLAGWAVGFAWAGLCWLIAHRLEHGDEMETDLGTSKA